MRMEFTITERQSSQIVGQREENVMQCSGGCLRHMIN